MNKAELKRLDSLASRISEAVDWLQELNSEKDDAVDRCADTEKGEARKEALEEDIGFIEEILLPLENLLSDLNDKCAELYW